MTGLLDSLWNETKEVFGGLLKVDPELQARRDAEAKALYDSRAQSPFFQMLGWGEGNDERSDTNVAKNFLPNVGAIYRDTATMATNPAPTTEAISNLVAGGVLNFTYLGGLLGEDVGVEQREMANEFGQMVKTTFGSWENLKTAAIRNPADVLGILVGAGFAVKGVKDLVTNPAVQAKMVEQLQRMGDPTEHLFPRIKKASGGLLDLDPRHFAMMWHGSKHPNIQKFDEKYMGTGQGADAYGWGFYNAQHHDVSVSYQGQDLKYEEDMMNAYDTARFSDDYFQAEMYENAMLHMNPERSLNRMLEAYPKENHAEIISIHKTWQDRYKDADFSDVKTNVPDHAIATMLNDDVPVWEQPQIVQDYLRKENGAYMDLVHEYKPLQIERERLTKLLNETETDGEISGLLGQVGEDASLTKDLQLKLNDVIQQQEAMLVDINSVARGSVPHPANGRAIYDWLVDKEITEKGIPIKNLDNMSAVKETISKRLDANGILGRKYKDEKSRYTDGGTFNTVTFNENTALPISNKGVPIYKGKGLDIEKGSAINIGFAGNPQRVGDVRDMQGGILDQFGHEIIADNIIEAPEISIFDLEGRPFVSSQADLTRAGGLIQSIDGVPLKQPVEMMGGQDYMWLPRSVKENLVWASDAQPINKLVKEAQGIAKETGKEPIYIPFRMKPTGMDYSKQIADSMIQSALVRLNKSQIAELNDTIRAEAFITPKDSPKKLIGENFKGIDIENPLNDSVSGDLRKEIIRIMDRDYRYDGGQKIKRGSDEGTSSLAQVRVANADPTQLNKEPMTLQNVANLDMDNLKRDVSFHDTYNTGIGGEALGRIKEDVSLLDLFTSKVRDKKGNIIGDYMGSDGNPMTRANWTDDGYRKTTMQPVSGLLDHDRLMQIERNMKRKGLL